MVIIQTEGGLGNQMFQYALYCSFIDKRINAKLDISKFKAGFLHNGYELEKIFNLNANYCTATQKCIIKTLGKLLYTLLKHPYKEKQDQQWYYQEEVTKITFGFLKGYWQSEKYFADIFLQIRKKFTFPLIVDDKNKEILEKITSSNAVSLHIRRGDYLTVSNPCTINIDYYFNAINLINERISDPYYFVFSDDIQWAKEHIKETCVQFIDWNFGKNSYIDMQLMSLCKHNIIANSSFSWWGAWLNSNPSKIVIAPQKWMPHLKENADILVRGWTLLPSF